MEKFHYYVYGMHVLVQSDHKPLKAIMKKLFDKSSVRLQRFCLRLLRYQLTVDYTPGSCMFVADTLSRAFITTVPAVDLVNKYCVHAHTRIVTTEARRQALTAATAADPTLSSVIQFTHTAWPPSLSSLPSAVQKFNTPRHGLSTAEGLLFFENHLVVPSSLQPDMLNLLHGGHLNVSKTKQLARNTLFLVWHVHRYRQLYCYLYDLSAVSMK